MEDRSGAGSLAIDGKKLFAIKHWMESTCPKAHQEVQISLKDAPFAYGPWGEPLSLMKGIFLDSGANQVLAETQGMTPLANEATIPLDWNLTLKPASQEMLFRRVRLQFEKSTAIVDDVADKRRYRMGEEELMNLRNLLCIWSQVSEFCSSRLDGFDKFQEALTSGSSVDAEFADIMLHRPPIFALSFLPRAQVAAVDEIKKQEEVVTMEAQRQRFELREARWKFFTAALERDQEKLRQVQGAPEKLQALRHRKMMAFKMEQAKAGERVIRSYMEQFLRCELVEKMEHGQLKMNEFRAYVVPWACHVFSFSPEAQDVTCKEQDVHVITIADLNVPLAKSKQRMEEICRLMQFCNDVNGLRHCGVIELPEVAKSTSKRGLADEERELEEELWGLRQACDSRWILPFDVMPQAEHQTNRRTALHA